MAKKTKKEGPSSYMRSVSKAKTAAARIARQAEKKFGLPSGCVNVCITKLPPTTRKRIVDQFAA